MELPFSPSFFKKIEIYQQLKGYQKIEHGGSIWIDEKSVLLWYVSSENTSKGSPITRHRIKDIIDKNKTISLEHAKEIFHGLSMRRFLDKSADEESGFFNRDAYFAGEVLTETIGLGATRKYDLWILIWWIILISALIIVLCEAFLKLKLLVSTFISL